MKGLSRGNAEDKQFIRDNSDSGGSSISELPYGEDLVAGDLVQLYDNGGTPTVKSLEISTPLVASDGSVWSSITGSTALLWGNIAYGNGVYVAAPNSSAGSMRSTDDGLTWTSSTNLTTSVFGITYGNGIFMVAGLTGFATSSDDGVTWTQGTFPGGYGNVSDVAYGNIGGTDYFIATSSSNVNTVAVSTDNGASWTLVSDAGIPTAERDGIAFGNGVFVIVARNSFTDQVLTFDGTTWTPIQVNIAQSLKEVGYDNGVFIAASDQPGEQIIRSADNGATWATPTVGPVNQFTTWGSIAGGGGTLVAVSRQNTPRITVSTDGGLNWSMVSAPVNNTWRAVTYNPDRGDFVAVSDDGTDRVMISSGTPAFTGPDPSLFFGIVQESGLTGETHPVATISETSSIHLAQVSGEIAYVQSNGTLGSVITDYPVGRYKTPTDLDLSLETVSSLTDSFIDNPVDGQVLTYSAATEKWINSGTGPSYSTVEVGDQISTSNFTSTVYTDVVSGTVDINSNGRPILINLFSTDINNPAYIQVENTSVLAGDREVAFKLLRITPQLTTTIGFSECGYKTLDGSVDAMEFLSQKFQVAQFQWYDMEPPVGPVTYTLQWKVGPGARCKVRIWIANLRAIIL